MICWQSLYLGICSVWNDSEHIYQFENNSRNKENAAAQVEFKLQFSLSSPSYLPKALLSS